MKKQSKKTTNWMSLREVIVASRPFWWINTGAPFFVGYFISTGIFSWNLVFGTIYFLFPYNLFMYGVNDIFDYESDVKNPRKIGIDGSVLSKTKHKSLWLWIALTNIPFWAYFFLTGSYAPNTWLLVIIFMALAYSIKYLRFKEIPLVDSFTSAFHYTSPFLYGIFFAGGENMHLPAYVTFYVWVMANHAFGAIQDITPDRQAGIGSIATAFGAARTIIVVLIGYSVAALLPVVFYGWRGLPVSILLAPYVYLVVQTIPKRADDTAPVFRQNWHKFLYANYAVGFLLSMYFIVLAYY